MISWKVRQNQNESSELKHYGVKGMKWGVRKEYESLHKSSKTIKKHPSRYSASEVRTTIGAVEMPKSYYNGYKNKINQHNAATIKSSHSVKSENLSRYKKDLDTLKSISNAHGVTLNDKSWFEQNKVYKIPNKLASDVGFSEPYASLTPAWDNEDQEWYMIVDNGNGEYEPIGLDDYYKALGVSSSEVEKAVTSKENNIKYFTPESIERGRKAAKKAMLSIGAKKIVSSVSTFIKKTIDVGVSSIKSLFGKISSNFNQKGGN